MDRTLDYKPKKLKPRHVKVQLTPESARLFNALDVILVVLLLLIALADLWTRRIDPYSSYGTLLNDLLYVVAAVGVPFTICGSWLFRRWKFTEPDPGRSRAAFRSYIAIAAAIVITVGSFLLNMFDVPFIVVFSWSRTALEKAETELRADSTKTMNGKIIGFLPIEGCRIDGSQTSIFVKGAGFDVTHALVHHPDAVTPNLQPLGHDWYFADGLDLPKPR